MPKAVSHYGNRFFQLLTKKGRRDSKSIRASMDLEAIYREQGALLEGHFLLSSGNHSAYYLQSAKVLERPPLAQALASKLAELAQANGLKIDCVCAPALGGILAGLKPKPLAALAITESDFNKNQALNKQS